MQLCHVMYVSLFTLTCLCVVAGQTGMDTAKKDGSEMSRKERRKMRKKNRCGTTSLEQNITALWERVNLLSVPVNLHVHGADTGSGDVTMMQQNEMRQSDDDLNDRHRKEHGGKPRGGHGRHGHHSNKRPDDAKEEVFKPSDPRSPNIHIHLNMGGIGETMRVPRPEMDDIPQSLADEYVHASCNVMANTAYQSKHNVKGVIKFRQKPSQELEVYIDLEGFATYTMQGRHPNPAQYHGFHLHEFADYSKGCNSFGGHYNPHKRVHGGRENKFDSRHVGDWGNLESSDGVVKTTFNEKYSSLFGPHSIIGRGVVIHESVDDHGLGGTKASLASGNAGSRIACCVIGYASESIFQGM